LRGFVKGARRWGYKLAVQLAPEAHRKEMKQGALSFGKLAPEAHRKENKHGALSFGKLAPEAQIVSCHR